MFSILNIYNYETLPNGIILKAKVGSNLFQILNKFRKIARDFFNFAKSENTVFD